MGLRRIKALLGSLTGRLRQLGGRGKSLRSDRGSSRWSTYLTETVAYHH